MTKLNKPFELETSFSTYQIDEVIGEGGCGKVYGGIAPDQTPVAVKILNSKVPKDKQRRFKNELSFLLANQHPNVVSALDHGLAKLGNDTNPFYVMPRYSSSLRKLMKAGIEASKVLPYFSQILDGVETIHLKGNIHRDLKPENILHDLGKDSLAIADLGAARFSEDWLVTAVDTGPADRLGNFQYASPEQRTPGVAVDRPADIWALGMILNEMYTGTAPHGTSYQTIAQITPEFGFLDKIVSQAISQAPTERQNSIEQIKSQIMKYQFEAVTLQKLSSLNNQVVSVKEIEDGLALAPPRLVDAEWSFGQLTLILDRPISPGWIQAFYNMGSYMSLVGADPGRFAFQGNRATVSVRDDQAQMVIDYFKGWLPNASNVLKGRLEAAETHRQRDLANKLRQEREAEERNLRVNRSLRV